MAVDRLRLAVIDLPKNGFATPLTYELGLAKYPWIVPNAHAILYRASVEFIRSAARAAPPHVRATRKARYGNPKLCFRNNRPNPGEYDLARLNIAEDELGI
jgi:hypothetical protein